MKTAEEVARQLWWDMTEFHEASCDSWSKEVAKTLAAFAYERASEVRAEVVLDMTASMTKLTEDAVLLARNDALEEAAKVAHPDGIGGDKRYHEIAGNVARRIRALKSKPEVKP
jgi:hypothetical protein